MAAANQITINFDSVTGTAETFKIYNLDWSVLINLAGYQKTNEKTLQMDGIQDSVNYVSFDFNAPNSSLQTAMEEIPVIQTAADCICQFDAEYYQIQGGDWHNLYAMDHAQQMTIGTMPDDWGTNCHYFTLDPFWSPSTYLRPTPVSKNIAWDRNAQYYLDTGGQMVRQIYLRNGYHFTCTKGMVVGNGTYNVGCTVMCGTNIEPMLDVTPNIYWRSSYVMTRGESDTQYAVPDSGGVANFSTNVYGLRFTAEQNGYYSNQLFFHAVIGGVDHYGILIAILDYATQKPIYLRGTMISENFWAANLGHDPGHWGVPSSIGGGQGTFQITQQDNRGDATGQELGQIIQARNSTMLSFFSGQYGYKLHQLLPADMQSIFQQLYSQNYFANWKQSFYNPLSAILTLHLIPQIFLESREEGGAEVKSRLTASGYDISYEIDHVNPPNYPEINPIVHKNIGSHDMEKYFDAFPDFAPYTRCYLHLPYVGVQEIDVNAIAHGTIAVDYVCDTLNGNIAAYVWCSDMDGKHTYKYCASGNCAYSIPLFANAQDGSALGKLIGSGASFISGLATGNASSIMAGIMGAGNAAASMLQHSAQFQGQFGSNAGIIMDTTCYLEIIRPDWIQPDDYQALRGLTSYMSGTLADDGTPQHLPYQGFVSVIQIDTDQIEGATEAERNEIETLLQAGIFIKRP